MKREHADARREEARARRFGEILNALKMATMPALALRFENLAHCFEASISGAEVLAGHRVTTRLVPVFMIAVNEASGKHLANGASIDEVHRVCSEADPLEACQFSEDNFHVVIDATYQGHRAMVDLSCGQLIRFGVDVPLAISIADVSFDGEPLVSVSTAGGWSVSYHRIGEERSSRITGKWPATLGGGLTGDLRDLTGLALRLGCDKAQFFDAILGKLDPSNKEKFLTFAEAIIGPQGAAI
jgi:hypothetical protein